MNDRTALLLVGSAKPAGASTSEALGGYLLDRLAAHGYRTETAHVHRVLRSENRTAAFLEQVAGAGIFVLAAPLYVDGLPYLVVRALEIIAAQRPGQPAADAPWFLAIANCGFPEAHHNRTALAICHEFAAEAGFRWAGGLALGGGGALAGRPLAQAGGMVRHAIRALDLAAESLAAGQPLPEEAIAAMEQPMMPARLYTLVGGLGWRMQALRNGAFLRLGATPLADGSEVSG